MVTLKSTYILAFAVLVSVPIRAQSVVAGSVVDPSGALVSGAEVRLETGGTERSVSTDSQGQFRFDGVTAANAKLIAISNGFSRAEISLSAGEPREAVRIQLAVASVGSTVVVTGSRQEVEIQNSAVAVNVATRQEFEIRNVRLPDQTLSYTEGVNVFRSKGAQDTGAGVGMRGFSGRSQSRVLVLLDGQPVNDAYTGSVNWAALPITELDRVEVARGPSSSLYGGNAMGGVIQMFTRPVTRRVFEGSAQYGTYGTMMYSGRFSDRLWNRLGITLAYQRTQAQGYSVTGIYATASSVASATAPLVQAPYYLLTTTGTGRYEIGTQGDNWFNSHSMRGRADYTFSEKTTFTFQFIQPKHQYGYDGSIGTVLGANGAPITSGSFFFNDGGLKRVTISPTLFVAGPGGETQNLYSASLLHTFTPRYWMRIAGGITSTPDSWFSLPSGSATFLGGPGTTTETPNRSSHVEVQLNWQASSRHKIVYGVEARQGKTRTLDYNLNDFAFRDSKAVLTKTSSGLDLMSAAYIQDDISLNERLTLILGGRYDNWRTYSGRSLAGPTNPMLVYPDRGAQALNGKVALAWQAPGKFVLRTSVGNAFRAPTLINLYRSSAYPPGTVTNPNPSLVPERMISWEVGARRQFRSFFDVDLTYFQNFVKNLIYTTTDLVVDPTGNTRTTTNAGRSRTAGVEFALRQRAFSWLRLSESYTLNDARITENSYIPLSVGRYVPFVPRNVATFQVLADRSRWTGSLSGRYVARTFNSDTNTDFVKGVPGAWDPYFEMEATAGYRIRKNLTAFVSVNNLLNRQYYEFYLAPGRAISGGVRFRLGGE